MKGLELSRLYYNEVFLPECRKRLPSAEGHFAAGLVGEGSECFGYDDVCSRDHSFGPRLCIWLTQEDLVCYGRELNALWANLPDLFMDYRRPAQGANEGKRSGVFSVTGFYRKFLRMSGVPSKPEEWFAIAEPSLAAVTNGEVYIDGPGEFSAVRKKLLAYYPKDVARYYMARHTAIAAQTGQYNLLRAYRHKEDLAASNTKSIFTQNVIAMVFLLNKTYRPFYKWAPRAMRSLPVLGSELHNKLWRFSEAWGIKEQIYLVEDICACLLEEMRLQGYTSGNSDFLMDHLSEIMERIEATEIRSRGIDLVF